MGQVMVNDAWRILNGAGVVRGSWSPAAGLPGLESCCPCAIWAHAWTKCCLKGRGGVCPLWPWWNAWYHYVPYNTVGHACMYKVNVALHFTNPLWALKQRNTLWFTHAHQWHHPTLSSSLPPPYQFTTTSNQFAATPTSLTKGCDKRCSQLDFNCLTLLPPLTGKRNKGLKEWTGLYELDMLPMNRAVWARHVILQPLLFTYMPEDSKIGIKDATWILHTSHGTVRQVVFFFFTLQLCMGNWVTCCESAIVLRFYQF